MIRQIISYYEIMYAVHQFNIKNQELAVYALNSPKKRSLSVEDKVAEWSKARCSCEEGGGREREGFKTRRWK